MADNPFFYTLNRLPRLLRYSFLPVADSAYNQFSWQRIVVMLLFWPVFILYLLITGLGLALDHLLFPGFRKIDVKQPVFVIGIPRSGTTFLHRLLAGDSAHYTTMTLQELIFAPAISLRLLWQSLARLDNLVGSPVQKLIAWLENRLFSGLDGVHSTRLSDPEEDYLALSPILQCFLLILPFGDPRFLLLSHFDEQADPREKQRLVCFYRGLIQRHLYVHGRDKTFLSKNPSFTPMASTLAAGFPDARFIACVRNPDKSIPSQVSSILIGARIFSGKVNVAWWRQHLMDMLAYYYQHLIKLQTELPPQQWALARMEQLAPAPQTTVASLYQQLGLPLSSDYDAWLAAEEEKARQFRSGHHYESQQLGISIAEVQQRFSFAYRYLGYPQAHQDAGTI